MLCFNLFSASYTTLQMKTPLQSIQLPQKNTEDSHLQMGAHALCYHELTPWTKEMRHKGV